MSRILIGERLENLQRYVPVAKPAIITDVNVARLYPLDSMAGDVITIGTGEKIKTLDTVREIYAHLVSSGTDRSAFIVGIGGGSFAPAAFYAAGDGPYSVAIGNFSRTSGRGS